MTVGVSELTWYMHIQGILYTSNANTLIVHYDLIAA